MHSFHFVPKQLHIYSFPDEWGAINLQNMDKGLFKSIFLIKPTVQCLWKLLSQRLIIHPVGKLTLRCATLQNKDNFSDFKWEKN